MKIVTRTAIVIGLLLMLIACGTTEQQSEEAKKPLTKEVTVVADEKSQEEEHPNPKDVDVHSPEILVNQNHSLPEDFEPKELVYPNTRFIFEEKIEKRMLRSDAARALEELFSAAEDDNIYLAGVSAYRSHSVQTTIFNQYVQADGEEVAKTYSAVPGTSEHETGLAIDVSGSTGACAAEDCFAETDEAKWLAEHADEYGFIIRYPKGKEEITGYKYEPWHIRYVGKDLAKQLTDEGLTLEEYYGQSN